MVRPTALGRHHHNKTTRSTRKPSPKPRSKGKQVGAETATLGRTFIRDANDANAFSKLSRYETNLERSLYKALHELQRLQAARSSSAEDSVLHHP